MLRPRPIRQGRLVLASLLSALLLASCDDEPLAPQAFLPVPCTSVSSLPAAAGAHLSAEAVRAMLGDAAGRIVPSLTDAAELGAAIGQAAEALGRARSDTDCRALVLAADLLAAQPDDPATRPDRAALALALDLAQLVLTASP